MIIDLYLFSWVKVFLLIFVQDRGEVKVPSGGKFTPFAIRPPTRRAAPARTARTRTAEAQIHSFRNLLFLALFWSQKLENEWLISAFSRGEFKVRDKVAWRHLEQHFQGRHTTFLELPFIIFSTALATAPSPAGEKRWMARFRFVKTAWWEDHKESLCKKFSPFCAKNDYFL